MRRICTPGAGDPSSEGYRQESRFSAPTTPRESAMDAMELLSLPRPILTERRAARGLWLSPQWWLIGVVAAGLFLPLLPLLLFDSIGISLADAPNHIRWLYGFHQGLTFGQWLPTWAAECNLGFGSYPFLIYGRLAYLWLTPFLMLTGDLWTAIQIGTAGMSLLGFALAYRTGRLFFDRPLSLLLAALYVGSPYLSFVMFAKFSVTGYFALCLIPWMFERLVLLLKAPSLGRVAWVAVAVALLISTHVLFAFLLCGMCFVLAMLHADRPPAGSTPPVAAGASPAGSKHNLSRCGDQPKPITANRWAGRAGVAAAVVVGLGLTAFYWSFLMFTAEGRHMAEVFSAEGDQFGHFMFTPGCWLIPDAAVPLCLIAIAGVAIYVGASSSCRVALPAGLRNLWWGLIAVVVGAILIQTPWAGWLWEHIGPLRQINRPHRFDAIAQWPAALLLVGCISVFAARRPSGDGISTDPAEPPRRSRWGMRACRLIALGHLALACGVPWYIYASEHLTVRSLPAHSPSEPENIRECPAFAKRDRVLANERWTDWQVRGRGLDEITVERWHPEDRIFQFSGSGGVVDVRTFYADGWALELDGQATPIRPGEPYGQISFDADEGRHTARLRFLWPPECRTASWFSLASMGMLGLLMFPRRRRRGIGTG